jgi:hypothetical protein
MFQDPTEKDVTGLSDEDQAKRLLEKFPMLTVLYTARMEMINELIRQFTHDQTFFYMEEDGGVPPYIVETIAWRTSKEFIAKISEALLEFFDVE